VILLAFAEFAYANARRQIKVEEQIPFRDIIFHDHSSRGETYQWSLNVHRAFL
jgi:hypothetical protein